MTKADLLLLYSTRAKRKPSLDLKLPNGSCCLTPSRISESPLTLSSRWRGMCEVFAERPVFLLDISGVSVGFSTALRPEHLCMPLVLSRLDYCKALFAGLPEELINRLQRVQNAAAWLIKRVKRRDHITPHLAELHWLPVRLRIKFKILVLVYKCINGLALVYLKELITIRRHSVNLTLYRPRQK
jgi:hypothetical protein